MIYQCIYSNAKLKIGMLTLVRRLRSVSVFKFLHCLLKWLKEIWIVFLKWNLSFSLDNLDAYLNKHKAFTPSKYAFDLVQHLYRTGSTLIIWLSKPQKDINIFDVGQAFSAVDLFQHCWLCLDYYLFKLFQFITIETYYFRLIFEVDGYFPVLRVKNWAIGFKNFIPMTDVTFLLFYFALNKIGRICKKNIQCLDVLSIDSDAVRHRESPIQIWLSLYWKNLDFPLIVLLQRTEHSTHIRKMAMGGCIIRKKAWTLTKVFHFDVTGHVVSSTFSLY